MVKTIVLAVIIAGIFIWVSINRPQWLTKAQGYGFDANGFPLLPTTGETFTKGNLVFTFDGSKWFPYKPSVGQVYVDATGVSYTYTSNGTWILTPVKSK